MNDRTGYRRPDGTLPAYIGDEVEYTLTLPQCLDCLHFQGDGRCNAFPDAIPDAIYLNLADHRQSFPGDHGIRWTPMPGVEVDADE